MKARTGVWAARPVTAVMDLAVRAMLTNRRPSRPRVSQATVEAGPPLIVRAVGGAREACSTADPPCSVRWYMYCRPAHSRPTTGPSVATWPMGSARPAKPGAFLRTKPATVCAALRSPMAKTVTPVMTAAPCAQGTDGGRRIGHPPATQTISAAATEAPKMKPAGTTPRGTCPVRVIAAMSRPR